MRSRWTRRTALRVGATTALAGLSGCLSEGFLSTQHEPRLSGLVLRNRQAQTNQLDLLVRRKSGAPRKGNDVVHWETHELAATTTSEIDISWDPIDQFVVAARLGETIEQVVIPPTDEEGVRPCWTARITITPAGELRITTSSDTDCV